jgi:alpha-glucosidase
MIGGVLDLYFFSGPSPNSVIEQYGELIGLPAWQPAWAFGFQLCRYAFCFLLLDISDFARWGYHDINDTRQQVISMRNANIPLEGTQLLSATLP